MIFVTVGSTDFDALVRAVDELAAPGGLLAGRQVEMQIGEGRYTPAHASYFRFAPSLEPYLERAELVIAHGGLGTAVEAMSRGRRLLAVANPDRYDDHQQDLLGALEQDGHLLWCRDLGQLERYVTQALTFEPKPYVCPPCTIHEVIRDYLSAGGRRRAAGAR
jgi:UDP-N-acetylglucosamine transferase subunit ALG13